MKLFLFTAFCAAVGFLNAQNWTGAINSDWNNPSNWSQAPQNGDNITISMANFTGAMAQPIINVNSTFSPAEVLIDGGAILTINANLTTTDRVEVLGDGTQVIFNTGVLNISGGAGNARIIFGDLAELVMNGGTMNVGQRLLFELGGIGTLNSGTINVAETFALIDGVGSVSSKFIQNGGTLITDEFGFENEAGNFHPIYQLEDGTLTVETTFLVEGIAPGSGIGELIVNGGTVQMNASMDNPVGSTMSYNVKLNNDAVFNMVGAALNLAVQDSLLTFGDAIFNVNANLQWNNEGVIYGEEALIQINQNTYLLGDGSFQFPNLIVATTKNLFHHSPSELAVNGNFELNGNYAPLDNKLVFNGSQAQAFILNTPIQLEGLEINNSDLGVGVTNSITVNHSVDWNDGILHLGANSLTFVNDATSNSNGAVSFADGKVIKIGDDTFVFPVGTAQDRYRPISISAPSAVSSSVSVNYFDQGYTTLTPVTAPLQSVSALEYWEILTGNENITIGAGWNDANASGLTDCSSLSLARFDGASWGFIASTTSGLCNGNNEGSIVSTSALNQFGIFTIGFTEGVYQQAVTLCYGDSILIGTNYYDTDGIYIDTLTDINSDDSLVVTSLTILPQIDLNVDNNIDHLFATAGNAGFQWLDCNNSYAEIPNEFGALFYPSANGNYAVEVNYLGCIDTSICYVINQLSLEEQQEGFSLYPNPVNSGEKLTLNWGVEPLAISLLSVDGKEIGVESSDNNSVILMNVAKGMYYLKSELSNGQLIVKEIVVR